MGTLKFTPFPWLPTLNAIAPSHLRSELATQRQHSRLNSTEIETQLKQIMKEAPTTTKIKSRQPFYTKRANDFNLRDKWKQEWKENIPTRGDLVEDLTNPQPGFRSLTRKQWTIANRIRTRHGKTAENLHKWGYRDSPTCPKCHAAPQDMGHIVFYCPSTSLPKGYAAIHEAEMDFINWLDDIGLGV